MGKIENQSLESVSRNAKGAKINGEWYNSKYPVFEGFERGTVVSFEYNEGGDGAKFVKGKVAVVNGPSAATATKGTAAKSPNSYEIGSAIGMSVNNAVQICIANNCADDLAQIREIAIGIYKLAEGLKSEAAEGKFESKATSVSQKEDSDDESPNPFVM